MDDLVRWLGTQLDTDAETVGAVQPDAGLSPQDPIEFILAGQDVTVPATEAAERHIRKFADPARVLREIEATRQIVEECARTLEGDHGYWLATFVLRREGLRFSHRPGYKKEWAP